MKFLNIDLISLRVGFVIVAVCAASIAYVLPIDRDLDDGIGQKEYEGGMELMRMMGVPDAQELPVFSSWAFPTSIVVRGVAYQVKLSENLGDFQLAMATNQNEIVLSGSVVRLKSAMQCRRIGFGRMAMSSLGVRAMANCTLVSYPMSDTNTLFLTRPPSVSRHVGVLGSRNLLIMMQSQSITNLVECSLILLNAGLPESERLPLPQPQP